MRAAGTGLHDPLFFELLQSMANRTYPGKCGVQDMGGLFVLPGQCVVQEGSDSRNDSIMSKAAVLSTAHLHYHTLQHKYARVAAE